MIHKVRRVRPLPDFCLSVDFENGERRKHDVKPLFGKWDAFMALSQIEVRYPLKRRH